MLDPGLDHAIPCRAFSSREDILVLFEAKYYKFTQRITLGTDRMEAKEPWSKLTASARVALPGTPGKQGQAQQ